MITNMALNPRHMEGPKANRLIGGIIAKYSVVNYYLDKPSKILDVCAGSGFGTELLEKSKHECYPLDYHTKLFAEHPRAIKADLLEYTTKVKYDAIVMIDAIEHFEGTDQPSIIKKLHSWLAPGGILVVDTPLSNRTGPKNKHHLCELTWGDFKELMETQSWEFLHRYHLKFSKVSDGSYGHMYRAHNKKHLRAIRHENVDQIIVVKR